MKRSARITLHPEALQHNLKRARQAAPDSKTLAVIKANAYGHGAVETAGILYQVTDGFAVSCISEAVELREAKIDCPITVLQGHQTDNDLRIAAEFDLRLVIHDSRQLSLLDNFSQKALKQPFKLTLKIDTGMHRLGFHPDHTHKVFNQLKNHVRVNAEELWLMTHLSCADELNNSYTKQQLQSFEKAANGISSPKSIANSAGILGWKDSHADWIRPGIMLYGSSPFAEKDRNELGLEAAMTLNAPVIAVHNLKKGDYIGYGASWQCPQDTSIAVIACGYADGYPRHAASGTPVWINAKETRLLGRVSMDMIIIDVSDYQESPVQIGDIAELWGRNLNVDKVALAAETIAYEILCNAGNIMNKSL